MMDEAMADNAEWFKPYIHDLKSTFRGYHQRTAQLNFRGKPKLQRRK